jgi:hypothetical protein
MKRTFLLLSSLLLTFAVFAQQAPAPKPQLYVIHEEVAKPSALMQYEASGKDFIAALSEKKFTSSTLSFTTFMTPDFHYIYVAPIANFAAYDAMQGEFGRARDTVGASRWDDFMRRGSDAMVSYNESVMLWRPDLSYMPANPRLAQADRRYYRWDFHYLNPGQEKESEAIARDFAALFRQKNMTDSFNIYTAVLGTDLPLLLVAIPARSESDLLAADERINSALGADIRPLHQRAMAITRRFERREGTLRPDLSYPGMSK